MPCNAGAVSQGTRLGGAELRRFDLNLLVGLHALLYFRNVTRAAEHVGVSQPAMSRELRQLRQLFGDELLVRVGREYRLTTLARELIEPLGQVIVSIEGAVARRPSFDPAVETRSFTLGNDPDRIPDATASDDPARFARLKLD